MARHPVITGLGVIASPGCGVPTMWEAVSGLHDGLKPLTLFPSPRHGTDPVGEVSLDLIQLGAPRNASRTDRLGWLAAREAIQSAGLTAEQFGERAGIVLGSSVGGSFDSEHFLIRLMKEGKYRPRPTRFHECHSAADLIADSFGLYGPAMTISTACSSSALAIGAAAEMIQASEADVVIAGGADSISRMTWGGFHALLLVDGQGCRPFDATRGGMSLGEGAGMLVLEAEETALRRGAKILARLSGWGASCDAHHVTAPHPEGAGAFAAMRAALRRAGLDAAQIDYVNAHGTGTRDNDLAESKALKSLFGERVPPFSSSKRFFGHSLAASGAIEAVVCVEALRRQQMPANPGFKEVDPAIGLAPVQQTTAAKLTHVMSNSFGFGGNNAVLIFSTPEAPERPRAPKPTPISITGLGVVGPGGVTSVETTAPLPVTRLSVHACNPLPGADKLSPNQRRRLGRIHQMAILAARASHTPAPEQRVAVALGTGLGCLAEGAAFIENYVAKDEAEPMPSRFPGSVHNAPAGQIAMDLGARALNSAPTAGSITFECALWQARRQLEADEADVALAGAVDELQNYMLGIGKRWGVWTEKTLPGEGTVIARLEHGGSPIARVTAIRLGRYRRPFDPAREAAWIVEHIADSKPAVIITGAGGWAMLEPFYAGVIAELPRPLGRSIEHQTYKSDSGEFYSASGFGFAAAVKAANERRAPVVLYTLSPRGGKALCIIEPAPAS